MKNFIVKYKYILGITAVLIFTAAMFSAQVIGVHESLTDPDFIEAGEVLAQALPTAPSSSYSKLVIIIDDFGQSREGVKEMLELPAALTTAVMPFLGYSEADANAALAAGHEVILHIPFYTSKVPSSWLGSRIISTAMSEEEITKFLDDAFAQLPMARGINNHIGPMGCENSFVIKCLLSYLSSHQKYMVDSVTSSASNGENSAQNLAKLYQMEDRVFKRTFFLDGSQYSTVDDTKKQLRKAALAAKESGLAIVIGHVGTEGGVRTAKAISDMLPWLAEQNIIITHLSEI